MRLTRFLVVILLGWTVSGCGQSQTPSADGGTEAGTDAVGTNEGPAAAVHDFLTAVKAGNDAEAAKLLTPAARKKTEEYDMVVAPPGSDTASFKIGDVELIGGEGAHVASFWTDLDDEGNKHTDTIIWMVRKEPVGWRIAGMATRLDPEKPAVILNFEEPEEMLAKQQALEEEMSAKAGREEPSAKSGEETSETADTRAETPRRRPAAVPNINR